MRIGRTVAAAIAVAAIAVIACGGGRAQEEVAGARLTIGITPGEHWLRGAPSETAPAETTGTAETVEAAEPAGRGPEVAIWLEDPAGSFVATIFVTRRAAVEDWAGVGGVAEGEAVTPRPLPVWAGSHRGVGVEPMASCGACHGKRRSDDKTTAGDPVLEEMTGPAPSAGLTREWPVPERVGPGIYGIRVEVNHWMDPNERYGAAIPPGEPDSSGGPTGSGQPSLVWGGVVEIGADPSDGGLTLIGHGHPYGANGEVDSDLAGLTTALSIVDTIHVAYAPSE
jgi:hypothetical protein